VDTTFSPQRGVLMRSCSWRPTYACYSLVVRFILPPRAATTPAPALRTSLLRTSPPISTHYTIYRSPTVAIRYLTTLIDGLRCA